MLLIPSLKKITKTKSIQVMEDAQKLYLSLEVYRGILKAVISVGEKVKKYQLLAESEGVFSSKLHAPVSGKIISIDENVIILENDFKNESISVKPFDISLLDQEEILKIISNFGIEGSGGAKFPTHLKYNIGTKKIETFIINGAECEPYLSADYVLMKEKTEELLNALLVLNKLVQPKEFVFAIEKQNRELKVVLEKKAKNFPFVVKVKILPNEYPQGGELQLIKSVTKKELPKGCIPSESGILVSNIGTLWAVYNAFYNGIPYTKRIITVSGKKSKTIGNFEVKIGTSISHILKQTYNNWAFENQAVILGGPMMGKVVSSENTSINKGSGGVLILNTISDTSNNCIECGYCVDVCPQHLMPLEFVRSYYENTPEKLLDFHLQDCIECGACAYVCPSDVPLMQSISNGKNLVRL